MNGELYGAEEEPGRDDPRGISGGDPAGKLVTGPGPEPGRAGRALRRQPDAGAAGSEADAYPGHGGVFQQGTFLRADLQREGSVRHHRDTLAAGASGTDGHSAQGAAGGLSDAGPSGQGVHPLQRNGRCGQCPPHGPGLPPGASGAGREPVSQRGL